MSSFFRLGYPFFEKLTQGKWGGEGVKNSDFCVTSFVNVPNLLQMIEKQNTKRKKRGKRRGPAQITSSNMSDFLASYRRGVNKFCVSSRLVLKQDSFQS